MLILAACSMAFAAQARSQNARGPIRARFRRLEGHIRSNGMAVTDGGELVTADNGGDNILAFHAIAAIPIRKASTNSRGHHAVNSIDASGTAVSTRVLLRGFQAATEAPHNRLRSEPV